MSSQSSIARSGSCSAYVWISVHPNSITEPQIFLLCLIHLTHSRLSKKQQQSAQSNQVPSMNEINQLYSPQKFSSENNGMTCDQRTGHLLRVALYLSSTIVSAQDPCPSSAASESVSLTVSWSQVGYPARARAFLIKTITKMTVLLHSCPFVKCPRVLKDHYWRQRKMEEMYHERGFRVSFKRFGMTASESRCRKVECHCIRQGRLSLHWIHDGKQS